MKKDRGDPADIHKAGGPFPDPQGNVGKGLAAQLQKELPGAWQHLRVLSGVLDGPEIRGHLQWERRCLGRKGHADRQAAGALSVPSPNESGGRDVAIRCVTQKANDTSIRFCLGDRVQDGLDARHLLCLPRPGGG